MSDVLVNNLQENSARTRGFRTSDLMIVSPKRPKISQSATGLILTRYDFHGLMTSYFEQCST